MLVMEVTAIIKTLRIFSIHHTSSLRLQKSAFGSLGASLVSLSSTEMERVLRGVVALEIEPSTRA